MFYSGGMGSNRRYADKIDAQMSRRISEMAIRPQPVSLSEEELDAQADPIIEAKSPVRIRSWVRYPETVTRVEGTAVAWTSRAVKIAWKAPDGVERTAWVWASSVDRLD